VPSSALRFKPKELGDLGRAPTLEPGQRRVFLLPQGDPIAAGAPAAESTTGGGKEPNAPKLEPAVVRVGISDGVWTELRDSTLVAGTEVVTSERAADDKRRKFLGIF
jgi:hypothetical protein